MTFVQVDDRVWRLADERVADAVAGAVLRRHLLPADVEMGTAGLRRTCSRRSRASGARSATRCCSRRRPSSSACADCAREAAAGRMSRRPTCSIAPCEEFAVAFDRAARRVRRRAEVPAAERAAVPAARARAHRRQPSRATWSLVTLRAMALGGHARPHRRRIPPLLGRRRLAGAALREDALRPGAARAGVRRGGAGDAAIRCSPTSPPTRWTTSGATSPIPAAASIRPRTPTACRPSRRDDAAPAQDGGRVLHLARRGDSARCSGRMPTSSRCATASARRQRAVRPAGRVHAQEPALYRALDRGDCVDDRTVG